MTALKIVRLASENIKRLKAVEIVPNGHTVTITGKNDQGKTSVLSCQALLHELRLLGASKQAFRGYTGPGDVFLLESGKRPAPGPRSDSPMLGSAWRDAYRILDRGGDPELFRRVMRAMERFEGTLKQAA